MTSLSAEVIRDLAAYRPAGATVTTCYLDVDGRRFPRRAGYEQEFERLVRSARADGVDGADLEAFERHVRAGVDRSSTRGLAMFSCAADGYWRALALPVPVPSRVVAGHAPAVGALEALLQHSEPLGVLLADRQRVRVLVFELGELTDYDEQTDELLRDVDDRDERARGDGSAKVEDHDRQHLRRAAAAAFAVHQRRPFTHLFVGAPAALVSSLEEDLHPYLRERLRGRLALEPTAGIDAIRTVVVAAEAELEAGRERMLQDDLRSRLARGERAVAGLGPVLDALAERRVEHLLVSAGYEEAGWSCPGCAGLAQVGPTCARCDGAMAKEADVVAAAVDAAVATDARVDVLGASADLDVAGRIGAFLRF